MSYISKIMWSSRFETWASPISDTTDQKCANAESVIRSAIGADATLSELDLRIFAQGSYKANTNVNLDSDIDICICNKGYFQYQLPAGYQASHIGIIPNNTNQFPTYKNQIKNALLRRFTPSGFTRGDKAFRIHENTYRINADVIPAFEFREYRVQGSTFIYESGICFYTDSGDLIINWPEHTHANGIEKNNNTSKRYKKVVRVLKGLRNEMDEKGTISAKKISSFQIACLAHNVPDSYYTKVDMYDNVSSVAGKIWYDTLEKSRCFNWTEIDNKKILFPSDTKRVETNAFFWDLQKYVGMVDV